MSWSYDAEALATSPRDVVRFNCKRSYTLRSMRTLQDRFWAKVNKRGPMSSLGTRCWVWTGSTSDFGHGQIRNGPRPGVLLRAHRLSYEWAYGSVPDGLLVLHRCDNPPCVRPSHLECGDQKKNMSDCVLRGRYVHTAMHREDHPLAKLDTAKVEEARRLIGRGLTYRAVAIRFGVSKSTLFAAVSGKTWK